MKTTISPAVEAQLVEIQAIDTIVMSSNPCRFFFQENLKVKGIMKVCAENSAKIFLQILAVQLCPSVTLPEKSKITNYTKFQQVYRHFFAKDSYTNYLGPRQN